MKVWKVLKLFLSNLSHSSFCTHFNSHLYIENYMRSCDCGTMILVIFQCLVLQTWWTFYAWFIVINIVIIQFQAAGASKVQPEGPPILASLGLTPRSDKVKITRLMYLIICEPQWYSLHTITRKPPLKS